MKKQELSTNARRTRWILDLEQYNFEVKHRKGRKMAHVDHFSRQTDHLEAAVVAGPLRVSFGDANNHETIKVAEENEPWLSKPPSPSTGVTWLDRAKLAATPWWEIPIKVKEEDTLFIHQATINPFDTAPKYILVILYDDEGIYMS